MDITLGSAAVTLPCLDVDALSAAARIDALRELQRARAWVDAAESRLLAALAEPGEPPRRGRVTDAAAGKQYVREEIACALQISPMTVNDKLHTARTLLESFPATLEALEAGRVTMRHARTLVEATTPLPAAARAVVETRVLAGAETRTPTEFRRAVTRAVIAADPRGADERHETARAQRSVRRTVLPDAMGALHAVLPAEDLQAVWETLQAAADAHPAHHDHCIVLDDGHRRPTDDAEAVGGVRMFAEPNHRVTRTVLGCPDPACEACTGPGCAGCLSRARAGDQRRADALVALLLGLDTPTVATRHGRRPTVAVGVALSTLLDYDDEPGDLHGYGPIPARLARRIAADPTGTWRRLITDPAGRVLDYGRSTYRPPQDLTDLVLARDRYCRFPGCGWQARYCELDHLRDWVRGGRTARYNLLAGCPRHHHLRHEAGWTVSGTPDGALHWTTPTGHTYTDHPDPHPIDTTHRHYSDPGHPDATGDPDPPPF